MSEQTRLLRQALQARPADEEADVDLAVEKMGDTAFEWIVHEVKSGCLAPTEMVRGLRLLSRLTRQFCLGRKGELLDLVLALAERHADREVRSAAVHIATSNVRLARGLSDPAAAFGRSAHAVQEEVVPVVRRAIEVGLTTEVEALARSFLTNVDKP